MIHYLSDWMTLGGCQMTIQLLSHSPSSTGQKEKIRWKSSRVDVSIGSLLIHYCHGQLHIHPSFPFCHSAFNQLQLNCSWLPPAQMQGKLDSSHLEDNPF